MRVAVFRAREDGMRTAGRLESMGHRAVLAPVMTIRALEPPAPSGRFAAVIFTSLHGVDGLQDSLLHDLARVPCFCVGSTTMTRAVTRGFVDPRSARAEAEALASLVLSSLPTGSRLLLVGGRDRKPTLERRLEAGGFDVAVMEAYAAEAIRAWPDEIVSSLDGGVEAALHYSRRSAILAVDNLRRAGLAAILTKTAHHCLSRDASEPLVDAMCPHVVVAGHPDEASLLTTLDNA